MKPINGLIHIKVVHGGKTVFYDSFSRLPLSINSSQKASIPLNLDTQSENITLSVEEKGGQFFVQTKKNPIDCQPSTVGRIQENFKIDNKALIKVGNYTLSFVFEAITSQKQSVPHFHKRARTILNKKPTGTDEFSFDLPPKNIEQLCKGVLSAEALLTWKGQLLDSHFFQTDECISVGGDSKSQLYSPHLEGTQNFARFTKGSLVCSIKATDKGYLRSGKKRENLEDIFKKSTKPNHNCRFILERTSTINYQIAKDTFVHLRYSQKPRQLSKKKLNPSDEYIKSTSLWSFGIHLALLALIILLAPKENIPKIKQLPARTARLLVIKNTPPSLEKEQTLEKTKTKPPLKVVNKKTKHQPKKVVIKTSQKIKVVNKQQSITKKQKNVSLGFKKKDVRWFDVHEKI